MKIIITESQFKRLIENIIKEEEKSDVVKDLEKRWAMEDEFRKIMKDVIEKTYQDYPDSIYYVDKNNPNKFYMEYNQKTKAVWIDYKKLWSNFESKYDLNYVEVRDFFKGVLKRDYNLRGVTPFPFNWINLIFIEEGLQFEGSNTRRNSDHF